ncbi:hypothetical protein RxyAA322_03550 [Rubrobacter xylanophilus]|uniref:Uncharacterized protein n=1 Tax=Rubrobacter xylanophilus TaxID=49319 RepID=A0A510HEX6_9ACTN|nr:hypothetical protein [Rubrobacter xylanophilus]BBL78501.1 hypothetical protein RxyAA322_03550 [Rubrobacter xylanophilus]
MGEDVERLVAGYIEALEGRGGRSSKPVTFSVRLSERDHARLVWLAEALGTQKTPLAEELLRAAMREAMERYARWASPEDPEGFLERAEREIGKLERGPRRPPGPRRGGPRGGPGRPV